MRSTRRVAAVAPSRAPQPRDSSLLDCCCASRQRHVQRYEDFCSAADATAIARFRRSAVSFASDDGLHETLLLQLWRTFFPDEALTSRVSKQWKALGFQGDDPATDFRGAGIVGLQALHFYAAAVVAEGSSRSEAPHAAALDTSVSGVDGPQQLTAALLDRGYPWACTALNVVFVLMCHLQLTPTPARYSPDCGAAIAESDPRGCSELYTFLALARACSSGRGGGSGASSSSSNGGGGGGDGEGGGEGEGGALTSDGIGGAFNALFCIALNMLGALWRQRWKRCATDDERNAMLLTYVKPALAEVWASIKALLTSAPTLSSLGALREAGAAALASAPFVGDASGATRALSSRCA